jgi:flagellar basal-body rod protein FlgG
MTSVPDLAVAILSQAQRRVEIAAQNIANSTTPAYKRRVAFSTLVGGDQNADSGTPTVNAAIDFRNGKLSETGKPTDLAISGPGYFALRRDSQVIYARSGQFSTDKDGRLVNAQGFALQLANGNDLVVRSSDFQVRSDRTVVEKGSVLGRISVFGVADQRSFEPVDGGFRAGASDLTETDDAQIRQGAIETSNVSSGDEMVVMMESLRRAEAGQRVMNVYDDLMGRVITSFGDSVR